MERIERPATVYWKSKTGKTFNSREACEKWEYLFEKWQVSERYREFENVEGQRCHAFWIETKEELFDVIWFVHYKFSSPTCNYVTSFEAQWVVACPDYNGYNTEMAIRPIKDLQEEVEDTLKAAQDTLLEITKLVQEKA